MTTNPYESPAAYVESTEDAQLGADVRDAQALSPGFWRYAIATLATGTFLYLGYLFLVSMRSRQWPEATIYLVGSLSSIPWALNECKIRDCFAGSIVVAIATLSAVASEFVYFAMFELDWFARIFNDKGAGEFGMLLFGISGFGVGGYACWRILALLRLTSSPHRLLKANPLAGGEQTDEREPE
ncbi:MAG: hypothetical protein U1E05_15485 [Patescibacteria group bacterium]|nr:hypothetical protein [Patescibacteria group bacterium]